MILLYVYSVYDWHHVSNICRYAVCAVARIALVKPEKARGVEDVLLNAAQRGQIVEKVYQINLGLIILCNNCMQHPSHLVEKHGINRYVRGIVCICYTR